MATERKKVKRKSVLKDELEKPTKEEYAVAKCLKFNAPLRQGRLQGNTVDYFIGSKIVDFLMESKWSSKKDAKKPIFTSRMSCVIYSARLLEKGFFHRVERPERKEKPKKVTEKAAEGTAKRKGKRGGDEGEEAERKEHDSPSLQDKADTEKPEEERKKKKKPPKLRLHEVQQFIDGPDLYVWVYDPVPLKTFIIGLLLVVGGIGVCLFPLWPPQIKVGIYYLSCAALGFIGVIFFLCILRMVVFVVAWASTLGRVSFWMLPNLTEDVGFFDSFKPLYTLERRKEDASEVVDAGDDGEKVKEKGDVEEQDEEVLELKDELKLEGENLAEEEDDEEDKKTNSSNGYEIVNPEDYEIDLPATENRESEEEEEEEEEEEAENEAELQNPLSKKIN